MQLPESGVNDVVDAGKKVVEEILDQFGDTPIKAISAETVSRGKEALESVLEEYGNMPIRLLNSTTFKDDLRDAFPDVNDELDTTFLLELLYFFPIDKTYISAGSYDQYLYDLEKTVIDNYSVGNFQVSFFYAHLIFMSYVYYCVERAYQFEPGRMKDVFYPINAYLGRNDKPDIEHLGSVYEFSKIPEKDIFKVFHVLGMEDAVIKNFSNYISKRDNYAHATGQGNISEDEFRQRIKTVIGNMSTLHGLFVPRIKKLYIDFMLERLECEYDVISDNFNDFVFDNSLSINDIDYLCHLGVKKLQESNETLKAEYQATRNIHCAFIEYCMENDGIEPPEGYLSLRNEKYLFFRYKGNAAQYVKDELGISAYACVKDGGRFPVFECVNCDEEQLVYNEEHNKYHCFACGEDYAGDALTFCSGCGSIMIPNEVDLCDSCIAHKMEE